jgi:Mechanosensitive ion channel, conserved TM helix
MDLSTFGTSLQATLGAHLPSILGGIAILVVGWLVAVAVRAGIRRGLGAAHLNQRFVRSTDQQLDLESGIAAAAFWLILLVTLIGVFNSLNLPLLSGPFESLVGQIVAYVPRLLAGSLLVIIAWLVATALRVVVNKALAATELDDKLSQHAGMQPMSRSVGNMLFWLVVLLFIPAIVGAYDLGGLLEPVKVMVTKALDMLPNVFAAGLIGVVGWILARVLSGLVVNVLTAAGVDRAGEGVGLDDSVKLSRLAGTIVQIFVFVPSLIAALDALKIEAISKPATEMLTELLSAVPNVIAAALILTVTYFVARFAASLVTRLVNGLGFDALPEKMGVAAIFSGSMQPSRIAGVLVLFFAMLFAVVEAANQLEFAQVRDVVTMLIHFAGDVLLGAVILVVGFWLANLAYTAIDRASGERTTGLANVARYAILGLVIAMGLRAMGIADDIVNLAFALTLGAVAVALALSFGLGGRDAAGKQMEHWLRKLRKEP